MATNDKLEEIVLDGMVHLYELADTKRLMERMNLAKEGTEACKFNFANLKDSTMCYDYTDRAGEYSAWGMVKPDGNFTVWSNWGGDHKVGSCNLFDYNDVFLNLRPEKDGDSMEFNLTKFLKSQISVHNAEISLF